MKAESLMMSHGYKPELSEGAVKMPIFMTSTFEFKTAEEGKMFFEKAYGISNDLSEEGLIYSRINNPNLEVLEGRLCLWDIAEDCAVFQSGMSAITTVLLEYLKPGDLLLHSSPTYGGTDHFINHFLPKIGVYSIGIRPGQSRDEIIEMVAESGLSARLKMIYLETPANPTNDLIDISMTREVADYFSNDSSSVVVAVDNTYMGPLWCQPLDHGADLVLYSATKFIGGHSDLLAGAVLGNSEHMLRIKTLRTFLGNMASPHTSWLLLRSLETLQIRMERQSLNAAIVADFLQGHPKVSRVSFLGLLSPSSKAYEIYSKQYKGAGSMISFEVIGGETEAFQVLNELRLIKLAVSLGSTESLAQHPDTMTHVGVCPELKKELGISGSLIRLSVGIENSEDLISDLDRALSAIKTESAKINSVLIPM